MRTLARNAILQVLTDAAGEPVGHDRLAARAAALLAPVTVVETEADHPAIDVTGTDYAWGSARSVTRSVRPAEIHLGVELDMLRAEGWVITRHSRRAPEADAVTLDGRSCLTAAPSLAPPPPGLPGDITEVMRLWLLSGGREGQRTGTLREWAGRVVYDDEFRALEEALSARGYVIETYGTGGNPVSRMIGTPDIPVQAPPPPGSDVRMISADARPPSPPVGLDEIAGRLHVKRPTADTWRARGVLPEPWWTVGGRPAWPWAVIEDWARRTGRMPEQSFLIMASDGSEGDPGTPARWILVDDEDCAIDGVLLLEDDEISDGLARLAAAGLIPAGTRVSGRDALIDPYPWQPEGYGYRWHATTA